MNNKLDLKDGIKEYLECCRKKICNYEKLILFGASKTGEKVYSFLQDIQATNKLCMVVDNDKGKYRQNFHGLFVCNRYEMKEFIDKNQNCLVMVASGSAHIIIKELEKEGINKHIMEAFPFGFIEVNPTPYEYINTHLKDILFVEHRLSDEKSKQVYFNILNFKMTRKSEFLSEVADEEKKQYLGDGFFRLGEEEYIVDCGSYIGDTLIQFKQWLQRWNKYTCIEADKNVYSRLEENIKEIGVEQVYTIQCGCWNKDGYVSFEGNNSETGHIVEDTNGMEMIETKKLDSLFRDDKVTFLKMDIEGAEIAALEGAESLIKRERPIMAISIYHSLEDFIKIPKILIKKLTDYNFYVRHYRMLSDSETVMYAVPKERIV